MNSNSRSMNPSSPGRGPGSRPKPSPNVPSGDVGPAEMALLLAYLSAVSFVLGLLASSFTMVPKLGGGFYEELARLFVEDDLAPRTFSLAGGILHLFADGEILLGGLILLFSVVFPLAKIAAIFYLVHQQAAIATRYVRILEHLGKWSMLDVFVIAAVVISFKGFPGGSQVRIEWGLYVFAASIILSMLAMRSLKRHFCSRG